jgi:hypothetical protein
MKAAYYLSFGVTATVTFSGLNQTNLYNFVFYGGATFSNTGTTVYQIGSQAATLNSLNNTTNTATLYSIKPDSSGSVTISIYSTQGYCFTNSITIQAMLSPEFANGNGGGGGGGNAVVIHSIALESETANESEANKLTSFPNPFVDDVTLKFGLKQNVAKFTVAVTDLSGRTVYRKEFYNAAAGTWQQRLGINGRSLNAGMYIVQVLGIPGEKPKTFKLVKLR